MEDNKVESFKKVKEKKTETTIESKNNHFYLFAGLEPLRDVDSLIASTSGLILEVTL